MIYGHMITFNINPVDEAYVDNFINDIYSFKDRCHKRGKLFGKPNYIINVIDETEYDNTCGQFTGSLKVYFETENNGKDLVEDMLAIASRHDGILATSYVRKLKPNEL